MTPILSYVPYYGSRFEDFVEEASALKFQGIEFIPDLTPNLLSELGKDRTRAIAERLRELKLQPTVHSVFYDINLVSVVPEVAELALDIVRASVEFALSIGAREVTVHPGYQFPGWRSSEFQRAVFAGSVRRAMGALVQLAKEYDVQLFLENGSYFVTDKRLMAGKPLHFGVDREEIDLMMEQGGSNLGICLDFGKANVSNLDVSALVAQYRNIPFRFQVGSVASLKALFSTPEIAGVLKNLGQITYEGKRNDSAEFLTAAYQFQP